MQYFTNLSGFPADIFSSQLSFNRNVMKSFYALTNIELYRIAPSLDYLFMVGYGLILFSSSVFIARRFKTPSVFQRVGFTFAIFGVIAAVCDGIENIFILAMLANPIGFPNTWTVIHSMFALIKWILLFSVIMGIVLFGIQLLLKKGEKK